MLCRRHRLHSKHDYQYIMRRGAAYHTPFFIAFSFYAKVNKDSAFAGGVVCSKKVCSSAIGRNKIRRLLFDCLRSKLSVYPANLRLILVAKQAMNKANYGQVCAGFDQAISKILVA